jgi:hypothetical protein
MSYENAVGFWQKVQRDTELQDGLGPLRSRPKGEVPEAVAAFARRKGFEVTAPELLSTEAVVAFWDKAQRTSGLREKLEQAGRMKTEKEASDMVLAIAQESGFDFPKEALDTVTAALAEAGSAASGDGTELSNQDLKHVVGGVSASFNAAVQGMWSPRALLGPGVIATWC